MPNFLGDFYARGLRGSTLTPGTNTLTTRTLTFTGIASDDNGASGPHNAVFFPNTVLSGPGGTYTVTSNITGTQIGAGPNVSLDQNAQLTSLIQANFPKAAFANGTGTFGPDNILYNYLLTTGQLVPGQVLVVNLPDPSGGGLVGRNNFFDNGSPLPQDRVYFFYNFIGDYRGLGTSSFDINRYVFGVEKTFFDGRVSFEVRVPFAGTADSDQVAGGSLSVDHAEFGNLGLALKAVLIRTPNFLVSAGLGVSLPTADASRLLLNGQTEVEIQNRATLLQPLFGIAWAPNDRFYSQLGLQFDFDPSGNPVLARDVNNNLNRIGILRDQDYAYLSGAVGYWLYRNKDAWLTGVALQGELHYDSSFGAQHYVQDGNTIVADLDGRFNVLNATAGFIMNFGDRANLSLGVSVPLTGDRLYDWSLMAQVNYRFGPRP